MKDVDKYSEQCFPLCMCLIERHLNKYSHLMNLGRLQYTLFLKSIGLPVEEAVKFFKKKFEKIKEEEEKKKENEKDQSKDEKKGNKKEEENIGYSKNFKTMKVPKKNQNDAGNRKSLTPMGDTPTGDPPIPKMKVSKENMIKISTEPVANFYSIVKDLGHGSYGQVKKVKHKELGIIII